MYKCEVWSAIVYDRHGEAHHEESDHETITCHALNSRKAVNRAKRKYCRKHSTAWADVSGRVVAVWRWWPGWV